MNLKDLEFLFDFITEEEMKCFENENLKLKNIKIHGSYSNGILVKSFFFDMGEVADLEFRFSLNHYLEHFHIYFDVYPYKDGG